MRGALLPGRRILGLTTAFAVVVVMTGATPLAGYATTNDSATPTEENITTEPSTSADTSPVPTEPDTTEPDTTEPDTTEPDTTEPPSTEPPSTEPPTSGAVPETFPETSVVDPLPQPERGDYVVIFENDAASTALRARFRTAFERAAVGTDTTDTVADLDTVAAGAPSSRIGLVEMSGDEAATLAALPGVAVVAPNRTYTTAGRQVNPPWGLDRIDQRSASYDNSYSFPTYGSGVTAYIIDTGIWPGHPDFGGRVRGGFTAVNDGYGTNDCQGHGTHVAGTVGSRTYGVAKAVTLVPVRVLNCAGSGTSYEIVSGLNWMVGHHRSGPAVANMSLVFSGIDSAVDYAVQRAVDDGVTVVVAAGNFAVPACNVSPAHVTDAITVGATASWDALASFSNYGSCVDVLAPGVSILSTSKGGGSMYLDGTSMASPHVAGAAALWLSKYPTMRPRQVANVIVNQATRGAISGLATTPNRLLYVGLDQRRPANDAFTKATSIPMWSDVTYYASSALASREPGEPKHAGATTSTSSLWWKMTISTPGTLYVTTNGSDFDTVLGVYTGRRVSVLRLIASNDDAGGSQSTVNVAVSPGTYYIAVDGFRGAGGDVALLPYFSAQSYAPNDNFGAATSLGAGNLAIARGHNRPASVEFSEPLHYGSANSSSVWWRTRPARSGRLIASTQGSTFDTELALYSGIWGALTQHASNDDVRFRQSQVNAQVSAGTDYHLAVDGFGTSTGAVNVSSVVIPDGSGFYRPLGAPRRLLDTRPSLRGVGESPDVRAPLAPGRTIRVVVPPAVNSGSGTTVVVNLTTLSPRGAGTAVLYPCAATSSAAPKAYTHVFAARVNATTTSTVRLHSGAFCVRASTSTNLVIDIVGSHPSAGGFVSLNQPALLMDTRRGTRGALETTDVTRGFNAREVRRFVVTNKAGLPGTGADVIALSIGALNPSGNGTVLIWPCTTAAPRAGAPVAMTVVRGQSASGMALTATSNGSFCVQSTAATNLTMSVTGYRSAVGSYVALPRPARLLDSRRNARGAIEFYADESFLVGGNPRQIDLGGAGGVPAAGMASSVTLSVTTTGSRASGYLSVYPCASPSTRTNTLSFAFAPSSTTRQIIVGTSGANASICMTSSSAVSVVIDVIGWEASAF